MQAEPWFQHDIRTPNLIAAAAHVSAAHDTLSRKSRGKKEEGNKKRVKRRKKEKGGTRSRKRAPRNCRLRSKCRCSSCESRRRSHGLTPQRKKRWSRPARPTLGTAEEHTEKGFIQHRTCCHVAALVPAELARYA
eukprot:1081492-Rhodomonas_salina.2